MNGWGRYGPLALLWLVGFQLRTIILGVPPILPQIRSELHLSFSLAGTLSAIPVLGLGAAAVPGAILVNRFGARRVVALATLGLGVGGLLRLASPPVFELFFWTAVLSLSVAVAQPALAVVVRNWYPDMVQRASSIFATSLGVGALAGATVTIYLARLVGWRGSFVVWSALTLAVAALWLWLAPGRQAHVPEPSGIRRLARDPEVWRAAGLFGTQSLVFYAGATWVPFRLHGYSPGYIALVLGLMSGSSLVPSFLLTAMRGGWASSSLFYVLAGLTMTAGGIGFVAGPLQLAWLYAPALGVGGGMAFSGAMALPPLLARVGADVAGYAALMLTAGYTFSFIGPLLGGVLLDHTAVEASPFYPIVASSLLLVALGATMPRRTSVAAAELDAPDLAGDGLG